MTDIAFTLPSGRAMGVTTVGEPFTTRVVVFCHPMPGAGDFDPNPDVTRDANVRVLSFDRPGYGGSEPLSDDEPRTVQARADDIAEFLTSKRMQPDLRGGADFGVIGWGLGGAVALSLAARHPELISRTVMVRLSRETFAHAGDSKLPAIEGRPPAPGPPRFGEASLGVTADDPAFDSPGAADRLETMLAQAAIQGEVGIETDAASLKDVSWMDDLHGLKTPTTYVYGLDDPAAEQYSGDWLRELVPQIRVARVNGAAALTVVSAWSRLLDRATGA